MTSFVAGPIIGTSPVVELAPAAAGCVSRMANAPTGIPKGWLKYLAQSMAWTGGQFADESEYVHTLNQSDLQEAGNALHAIKSLELDGDYVSQENFPFPNLGPQLDRIRRDVYQGKGFSVIPSFISSSRYYQLIVMLLFFVTTLASAIDTSLATATSLESLSSTTSTFTVENSLPGCGWPKTLQDAQNPLPSIMSASFSLDIGRRPLLLENGNLELLVGIISLCSRDGWGTNLSQGNCQAKLQGRPIGDNPWAPRSDTVIALLSLMVAVLGLVPAYFNAFLAWRA